MFDKTTLAHALHLRRHSPHGEGRVRTLLHVKTEEIFSSILTEKVATA